MTFNQMRAAAEAILFAAGEPVETAKIAQALDIEIEDAETVLRSCAEQLDERESGVCLLKLGEKISALHAAGICGEYQKRARYEAQCSAFFGGV